MTVQELAQQIKEQHPIFTLEDIVQYFDTYAGNPDNLAKMILESPSEHEDYIIGASYRAASCKEEFVNGEWVKVA